MSRKRAAARFKEKPPRNSFLQPIFHARASCASGNKQYDGGSGKLAIRVAASASIMRTDDDRPEVLATMTSSCGDQTHAKLHDAGDARQWRVHLQSVDRH